MIATLISFEAIDIAITSQIDPSSHLIVEQKTATDYLVVKEGLALKKMFQAMLLTKVDKIEEENAIGNLTSPLFICFSAKNRKLTQPILAAICPAFQKHLIYFNIDKSNFGSVGFNRALLQGRQICYGQGLSQLRPKQELRIALSSILKPLRNVQYIFIEKYKEEIKQLKKEGFTNIIESFDSVKYQQAYEKLSLVIKTEHSEVKQPEQLHNLIQSHSFAKQYLKALAIAKVELPKIEPFDSRILSIQGQFQRLVPSSTHYNITPKSWINKHNSKEISSFIFHSSTDNRLYVARAARPRQFSNEEDIEIRVLTYYLTFLVNPEGFAVPHDKLAALMKFCKIKKFENKGTWFNVRPYIQGLATIKQILAYDQLMEIIQRGSLCGQKVRGLGGVLLFSWLINEDFTEKSLSEQLCLVRKNGGVHFLESEQIGAIEQDIYLCRSDFFSIFNMSNYKVVDDTFIFSRLREGILTFKLNQIHESYLFEMCNLLSNLSEERITMIRNLFIHYRWHSNLVPYYDLIKYRLQAIREYLAAYMSPQLQRQPSLLVNYPELASLMIPEDYSYFMLPLKNSYFPLDFSYQDTMAETKLNQNPYFVYMNKACSFLIYNLQFPVLTFMQWIKAGGRYQVIEYISMVNHTLEDYLVLDKRLKMAAANEKKNIVLIVDYAECCQELLKRPRSIKTVMVYRLRKPAETQDLGLVSSDLEKKLAFEQSEDELIRVLCKWGKASQAFASGFQLYDWVVASYSRIKCAFLKISLTDSTCFLGQLHKAISTNRHRLKQLQETYKDHAKHLYTFPIVKQQQKILLNYRLYEFIHMKNLFVQILEGTWNYKLQTYQNASINIWRPIIDPGLASRVVNRLMIYLDDISTKKMDAYQFKSLTTDGLEVIRSITQLPPNKNTLEEPCHLYFQAFLQLVKIQNYSQIEASLSFGSFLMIVDQQNIEINNGLQTIKIAKQQVKTFAFEGKDTKLAFFTEDTKACEFYINQIQLTNIPILGYSKVLSQSIKNQVVRDLLCSTSWELIKIQKTQTVLILACSTQNKLTIIALCIFEQEVFSVKQFTLEQTIIDLTFLQSNQKLSELLVVSSNTVVKYSVNEAYIDNDYVEIIRVDFAIANALVKESSGQLHVYLYKLHIIQHYLIVKGQMVAKQRYELNRNIKVVAVEGQLVYVFYQNCDVLDIMLLQGQQLERLWSYYWVDFNCRTIHVRAQDIYLKGSSYLKHMRIRNSATLQKKMVKNE